MKSQDKSRVSVAFIPAAGRGSRLGTLTKFIPKELLPIGQEPIIALLLQQLKNAGIKDVVIAINREKEVLRKHLGDGSQYQLKIKYVIAPPTGLDKALWSAKKLLRGGAFLFTTGDLSVGDKNLIKKLVAYHKIYRLPVLAVKKISPKNLSTFAVVKIKKTSKKLWVDSFPKKKQYKRSVFVSPGIMILANDFWKHFKKPSIRERSLASDLNNYLADKKILAWETKSVILDCGTMKGWLAANQIASK